MKSSAATIEAELAATGCHAAWSTAKPMASILFDIGGGFHPNFVAGLGRSPPTRRGPAAAERSMPGSQFRSASVTPGRKRPWRPHRQRATSMRPWLRKVAVYVDRVHCRTRGRPEMDRGAYARHVRHGDDDRGCSPRPFKRLRTAAVCRRLLAHRLSRVAGVIDRMVTWSYEGACRQCLPSAPSVRISCWRGCAIFDAMRRAFPCQRPCAFADRGLPRRDAGKKMNARGWRLGAVKGVSATSGRRTPNSRVRVKARRGRSLSSKTVARAPAQMIPMWGRARRDGYRSRAAYKLLEIDDKSPRPCEKGRAKSWTWGAAPGGWSQGGPPGASALGEGTGRRWLQSTFSKNGGPFPAC